MKTTGFKDIFKVVLAICMSIIILSLFYIIFEDLGKSANDSEADSVLLTVDLENKAETVATDFFKEASTYCMDEQHLDDSKLKAMSSEQVYEEQFKDKYQGFGAPEVVEGYVINIEHCVCTAMPDGYEICLSGTETFPPMAYPFTGYIKLDKNLIVTEFEKINYNGS